MSVQVMARHCLASGLLVALICWLGLQAPAACASDDTQTDVGTQNSTKRTYDPKTGKVTVQTKGGSPAPGSPSKPGQPVDHTGQVLVCGVWVAAGGAAGLDPSLCAPGSSRGVPFGGPAPSAVARSAMAQVVLPVDDPRFGPDPGNNKWGMIPVGYPVWLWSGNQTTTVSATVVQSGLSVSIQATRVSVTFSLGDGHAKTCAGFSVRPAHLVDPMQPSPSCGYVYQMPGRFSISVSASWRVDWVAGGESGTFTVSRASSAPVVIPVGELSAVIVAPPR